MNKPMEPKMKSKFSLFTTALIACLNCTSPAKAATYNQDTFKIQLDHVAITNADGSNGAPLSATLVALDDSSLHGGQIYRLSDFGADIGDQDGLFTAIDGKVFIPNLVQDELTTYNVTLILTKSSPLEFTVIDLTTSVFEQGAEIKVVFNQGPRGETGPAGADGPRGAAGAQGAQGPAGAQGAT
ncbi:MAG: hypothetical protein ACU84J_01225, partial [Gammaproteobacteria bacterium]